MNEVGNTLATFANFKVNITCNEDLRNVSRAAMELTKCLTSKKADISFALFMITRARFEFF